MELEPRHNSMESVVFVMGEKHRYGQFNDSISRRPDGLFERPEEQTGHPEDAARFTTEELKWAAFKPQARRISYYWYFEKYIRTGLHPFKQLKMEEVLTPSRDRGDFSFRAAEPQDGSQWSFLFIPGEVRNNIYHFALAGRGLGATNVALLRVCRLIYHEARSILYGDNIFAPLDSKGGCGWISSSGACNAQLVRYLRLSLPDDTHYLCAVQGPHLVCSLANRFCNLKHTVIYWKEDVSLVFPRNPDNQRRVVLRATNRIALLHALAKIPGLKELSLKQKVLKGAQRPDYEWHHDMKEYAGIDVSRLGMGENLSLCCAREDQFEQARSLMSTLW